MAEVSAAEKSFNAARVAIAEVATNRSTTLDLSDTPFFALERLPDEIKELEWLKSLHLWGTKVKDLEVLRGLPGLNWLSLSHTRVSDLEPLRMMSDLRSLYLFGTKVTDLGALEGLTKLTELYLSNTKIADLQPLRELTGLTWLDVSSTEIRDVEPLRALVNIRWLDLSYTKVKDLKPLRSIEGLVSLNVSGTEVARSELPIIAGKFGLVPDERRHRRLTGQGVFFEWSLAAREDSKLKEISKMRGYRERTIALFEELGLEWQSSSEDSKDIEQRLRGPVLAESIADVSKEADRFEATSIEDGPDREEDGRYHDLLETLSFAAERLAGTETANRIATGVAENFADYYKFSSRRPINARLLNYLAAGIRTALIDEDTRISLDAFDLSKISGFLEEHDTLVRDYHSTALQGPQFEVTTDPEVLLRELFPKLGVARDILKKADEDGLFAPSVSDALEMLNRRAEGARKRLFTSDDPKEREQAVADLRRSSVLVTAYLGRIKGRLVQWTKKQAEHSKENPLQTSVNVWAMIEIAKAVIKAVTPVFESLWRLIGNLPLPF